MERKEYPIQPSHKQNWREVFANPGNLALEVLNTGITIVPLSGVLNLKHPKAVKIENKKLELPILAFLIRHETRGNYLVDCGLDTSYQRHPYGVLKGLLVRFLIGESRQEKGQDVAAYLRENDVKLQGAFLTHLHFDHVAGALDLPHNIQYIVGKDEPYLNIKFLYAGNYLRDIETLYEIDFSQANEMPILGPCADVFGDGSLWAIPTTGHSRGHTSFLANTADRPCLITGDACFFEESFVKAIGPGSFCSDIELAQESLNRLVAFVQRYPQVKVLYSHQLPGDRTKS